MKGQQAVIRAPRQVGIEIIEVSDQPPAGGIVARAIATAISAGTERMWYTGDAPAIRSGRRGFPYQPGYSFFGEVIAAGDGANANIGDHVFAMAPHASHVVLKPSDYWVRLPDSVTDADATSIALVATGVHAIHRGAPELGSSVIVIGLGMVGLLLAQALRAAGCAQVIAVSASAEKRELAKKLGIHETADKESKDELSRIRKMTNGLGADVVFECTGQSNDMELACDLVRSKGRIVSVGMHTEPFNVSGEQMFAKELTILGSRSAGDHQGGELNRFSRREVVAEAARLVTSGAVRAAPLTSHRFLIARLAEAYELVCGERAEPYLQVLLDWA